MLGLPRTWYWMKRSCKKKNKRLNNFIFNLFLIRIYSITAPLPRLMQVTGFSSWSGRFWWKTKCIRETFEHQQGGIWFNFFWRTTPSNWTALFNNMLEIHHYNLIHKKDENDNLPLKIARQKSWWLSADGPAPPQGTMSGHEKVHGHPNRGIPNTDR